MNPGTPPLAAALLCLAATAAGAQIAVSVNGNKLVLYMVAGKALRKFGELPIGNWSRGVAFAPDGLTVLVQNGVQKDIQVFRIDGMRLVDTGLRIALEGGGAALRTADQPR